MFGILKITPTLYVWTINREHDVTRRNTWPLRAFGRWKKHDVTRRKWLLITLRIHWLFACKHCNEGLHNHRAHVCVVWIRIVTKSCVLEAAQGTAIKILTSDPKTSGWFSYSGRNWYDLIQLQRLEVVVNVMLTDDCLDTSHSLLATPQENGACTPKNIATTARQWKS